MSDFRKAICPACGSIGKAEPVYERLSKAADLLRCETCGLYFMWPMPLFNKEIYRREYYDAWAIGELGHEGLTEMKRATFRRILDAVAAHKNGGSLLDIGCAFGDLLCCARERGWDIHGAEISRYAAGKAQEEIGADRVVVGDFMDLPAPTDTFDVITMVDFIEHIYDLRALLKKCKESLKQNGLLAILTPDMDSLSRKCMARRWPHFKEEHPIFFSRRNAARILDMNGFRLLEASHFSKSLNLYYMISQIRAYNGRALMLLAEFCNRLTPPSFKKINFYLRQGEMFILAGKK